VLGGVIIDSGGNLFGTTASGGASGDGTVFEVAQGSGTITTLASFNGANGANPEAALLIDSSGNLYGTASGQGSSSTFGTVFELAQGSGTITTLASFNPPAGAHPQAGLVMDGSGNLYGTAGTVFELPAGSSTILTLAPGAGADAGLIMDRSGNLYGTTFAGGAAGLGSVFELPPTDQWTGANSAVDTNWSDGANWSLGAPPAAGQTVLFTNSAGVKSFTSTVDSGFTNAIGDLDITGTWRGTITVISALTVDGSLNLASGSFGGSGAVTVAGSASQWTGGQIDLGSGGFTNTGTLTADTTAGNLVLTGAGTLTNNGTINEAGTHALVLENSATLSNAGGGTFDLTGNGTVSQSGGGTLTNAGFLEKTGGTVTATIATSTLSNTGTVYVSIGTLKIAATVAQVSGKALTAGVWTVAGSSTVHSKLEITSTGRLTTLSDSASVSLFGVNTTFANLQGLRTIAKGASFSLLGGQSLTTAGALTDKGTLTLDAGSVLTVSGSFTQTSTGTLVLFMGGTGTAPTFGQLVSTTGAVLLAGKLLVPFPLLTAVGSSFELLDNGGNSAISGNFAGLAEGSTFTLTARTTTMTFQITYAGAHADGSNNVVITRIS
jgi:uncharacterized repeat protein (TIGR03803 family)